MNQHIIVGGKPVEIGLRVFTNDWVWGTVADTPHNQRELETPHAPASPHSETCQGWFDVDLDSEVRRTYDCSRMATRQPR
jgi:hypothetical protein